MNTLSEHTIQSKLGNISTDVNNLSGAISGTEMQCDIVTMPIVSTTSSNDFTLSVAKGEITGHEIWTCFGERDNVQSGSHKDIWRGNQLNPSGSDQIPIPPDSGDLISVISEDSNDTVAGTGVQIVRIHYLDPTGVEQTTDVNMNGTTQVDTAILMRFIQYCHSIQVGSNGVSHGHIKIFKTSDTTQIYCMIAEDGNMSTICNRMVPLNKTFYLRSWSGCVANTSRLTIRIRSTDDSGVLIPRVFLFKHSCFLARSSTGDLGVYHKIPALSICKISGWAESNGAEVSVSYTGILVDD